MVTLLSTTGVIGLSFESRSHAGDGLHHGHAGIVALAKERVVLVERRVCLLGDEELAAVGVRPAVCHRQASRPVEVQVGIEFIVEGVARIAHPRACRVAALNHEIRNHAMKGGAVVITLVMLDFFRRWVNPVLCALGQPDEVGDSVRRLLLVELASDAAHRGVHHHKWPVGNRCGLGSSLRRVGNIRACRLRGLRSRPVGKQKECRAGRAGQQGGNKKRMLKFHPESEGKPCGGQHASP